MIGLILFITLMMIIITIESNKDNFTQDPKEDWHSWYYNTYLQSKHWKKKRSRALCNARFMCQECGYNRRLQVHHLSYKNLGHELDTDLKVLCRECHKEVHGR